MDVGVGVLDDPLWQFCWCLHRDVREAVPYEIVGYTAFQTTLPFSTVIRFLP